MSVTWTSEQVVKLAPDDSSAKSGRGLVNARHWVSMGRKDNALWGECQGSGSKPYQVLIDTSEPAFKCSCPSRKFPCKHGIGLFLMFVEQTDKVAEADPPAWMTDWLASRAEKAEKKEAKKNEEKSPEELAKAEAQAAKRVASREKKVAQGLQDLELWLRDLARQGFSGANVRDFRFWDDVAARMVDAQAPGAGKMLRDMASITATEAQWQERLLDRLGLLYLLLEGYKRIDSLPPDTQADIRSALGFTLKTEEIIADPNARRAEDVWLTLGQYTYEEDRLRVRRTWLLGVQSGKFGLLVHAAYPPAPLEPLPTPGVALPAKLAFYPGASSLRAVVETKQEAVSLPPLKAGFPTVDALYSAYADALAANPWRETFPALLQDVTPVRVGGDWLLRDESGGVVALPTNWEKGWHLTALCGGRPLPTVFGEWDGRRLLPLTVTTADDRVIPVA
jgi:hypothetical protein